MKRARPHFRTAHDADGVPFIVMERYDGDQLDLFKKVISFDLPKSTTREEATEIANFLANKLVLVVES